MLKKLKYVKSGDLVTTPAPDVSEQHNCPEAWNSRLIENFVRINQDIRTKHYCHVAGPNLLKCETVRFIRCGSLSAVSSSVPWFCGR